MNALRNLFSNRAFTYLRQNGQNALINITQPPSVEANGSTLNENNNNNDLKSIAGLNIKPRPKPLLIPKSILDATTFTGGDLKKNGGKLPRVAAAAAAPGSVSPNTLKRVRNLERKMELVYRCKLCNTRNKKFITEAAYKNGVVILQCDGCAVNHLIIDNLGWFADTKGKSFDQVLAERNGANERIKVIKVNEKGDLI